MRPLDSLVSEYVAPVMRPAGFKRSGRTFRFVSDSGDQAVLGFARHYVDPDAVVFDVGYRMVPALYWEWINRQHWASGEVGAPRAFGEAVVAGDVIPPPQAAHVPNFEGRLRSRWALREGNRHLCGETLASALRDEAIPQMIHLLDRTNLLHECRHPTMPVVRLVPLTRLEILLRVDDAPVRETEALLADVRPAGPGDDFAAWVRRRLATPRPSAC
ncbi:hypothetical protein G3I32_08770 [Streptomyces coelicoflavus]|uniref:DUF4304 domain-containing protein n=1 Tax=Streptomyces coelicoflavus TaxID=285562 RepID=A0A7K3PGE9_9ACTN|nr:DUF4304 domain-containing protein [Streptomyces coelicoflavus]NEB08967.1 hypothetical protein [Streptomyces coelicoflavus]